MTSCGKCHAGKTLRMHRVFLLWVAQLYVENVWSAAAHVSIYRRQLWSGSELGAVLISGDDHIISWFSMWAEVQDLSAFLTDGKQTAIGELEALVVSMALLVGCRQRGLEIFFDQGLLHLTVHNGYMHLQLHTWTPTVSYLGSAGYLPLSKRDLRISKREVRVHSRKHEFHWDGKDATVNMGWGPWRKRAAWNPHHLRSKKSVPIRLELRFDRSVFPQLRPFDACMFICEIWMYIWTAMSAVMFGLCDTSFLGAHAFG